MTKQGQVLDETLTNIEHKANYCVVTSFLRDILDKLKATDYNLTFWTLDNYVKEKRDSLHLNQLSERQNKSCQTLFTCYILPLKKKKKTVHWVPASKQQYLNSIPDEAKALVAKCLHSEEASVVDNLNKHVFLYPWVFFQLDSRYTILMR